MNHESTQAVLSDLQWIRPLADRLRARVFDYIQTGRGSEGKLLDEAADELDRLSAAMDKIAERTGSDDPCRSLVQIARDALRHNVRAKRGQTAPHNLGET
jgi:hypothetical protein